MTTRSQRDIDTVVVHCGDTPNGIAFTVLDVDDWHRQKRWARDNRIRAGCRPHLTSVGYHRVIEVSGAVARGRSACEVGAHAAGINRRSLGVCMIGRDAFTLAQWHALRDQVCEWRESFPITRIIGHRDHDPDKTCPGFDVGAWLDGNMEPLEGHIFKEAA